MIPLTVSFSLLISLGISSSFDCSFNDTYPKQYIAYKLASNEYINIADGKLDDQAWMEIEFSDKFIDIANRAVPRFDTKMKMRWDDEWLYVGAILYEPQIWGNLTEDNTVIFHDNDFEIFLNPDATTHYYKEYEMNALNKTWDLCLNKPYSDHGYENSTRVFGSSGWTMIPPLTCGTYVNGSLNNPTEYNYYWTVEVKIPINDTLYNETQIIPGSKNGTFWRINFSRVEWHVVINSNTTQTQNTNGYGYQKILGIPEDNWVWSPQGIVDMHQPDRWGILQFSNITNPSVHTQSIIYYDEWPIREMAMSIYYAEKQYIANTGNTWTDELSLLQPYTTTPLDDTCLIKQPNIELKTNSSGNVIGYIATVMNNKYTATVTQDRYLVVQ